MANISSINGNKIVDQLAVSLKHSTSGTPIPSGSDLNNYTTPGNYYVATVAIAETLANAPSDLGGRLLVMTTNGNSAFFQVYIATNGETYFRGIMGGALTSWNRVADNEDVLSSVDVIASSGAKVLAQGTDINTVTDIGTYQVKSTAQAESMSNLPDGVAGRLLVAATSSDNSPMQIYFTSINQIWYRCMSSGEWEPWLSLANRGDYRAISYSYRQATAVETNSDLNDYKTNGNYMVVSVSTAETIANIPDATSGRLTVISLTGDFSLVQIYLTNRGILYTRVFTDGNWNEWLRFLDFELASSQTFCTSSYRTTVIPDGSDLDDYLATGNYRVTKMASADTIGNIPSQLAGRLFVSDISGSSTKQQIYVTTTNDVFIRAYGSGTGVWSDWKQLADVDTVSEMIDSTGANSSKKNLAIGKGIYNSLVEVIRQSEYNIRFANAPAYIDLANYMGNTQNVHPKVLYFQSGFGGHSYWMAYTPYAYSNDKMENPCIAWSDDGLYWTNIESNPIDDPHGNGYNSDTHLVYRSDTGMLECWFRYVKADENKEVIYRCLSSDGVEWTSKQQLYTIPNATRYSNLMSPAVEWDGGKYLIWVVSSNGIDYYEAQGNAPTTWEHVRTLDFTFDDNGVTVTPWHIDVIKDNGTYVMLIMCRNGKQVENNNLSLFLVTSSDNISYSSGYKVVEGSNNWDKYMYRSSIVKIGEKYRIYYSAGKPTVGNPTSVYNRAFWGIGITESDTLNNFVGMLVV